MVALPVALSRRQIAPIVLGGWLGNDRYATEALAILGLLYLPTSMPTPPDPVSALQAKAAELGIDAIEQVTSDADGILRRLLGPLAGEAGQLIAMPLRERRLVKTAKMLKRVEEKVQEQLAIGAERQTIPARGVVPLIEAASLGLVSKLSR